MSLLNNLIHTQAECMSPHLHRYGLEGSQQHFSALVQPLSVSTDLQRRLVDEGESYKWSQPRSSFIYLPVSLTSEAMVKPMTSMQPSSWRCGSKSR